MSVTLGNWSSPNTINIIAEPSEGNEKCVWGGGGGGAGKRGCVAAELSFRMEIFLQTQFPLIRKRSHSISCTVFYPKESLLEI